MAAWPRCQKWISVSAPVNAQAQVLICNVWMSLQKLLRKVLKLVATGVHRVMPSLILAAAGLLGLPYTRVRKEGGGSIAEKQVRSSRASRTRRTRRMSRPCCRIPRGQRSEGIVNLGARRSGGEWHGRGRIRSSPFAVVPQWGSPWAIDTIQDSSYSLPDIWQCGAYNTTMPKI